MILFGLSIDHRLVSPLTFPCGGSGWFKHGNSGCWFTELDNDQFKGRPIGQRVLYTSDQGKLASNAQRICTCKQILVQLLNLAVKGQSVAAGGIIYSSGCIQLIYTATSQQKGPGLQISRSTKGAFLCGICSSRACIVFPLVPCFFLQSKVMWIIQKSKHSRRHDLSVLNGIPYSPTYASLFELSYQTLMQWIYVSEDSFVS